MGYNIGNFKATDTGYEGKVETLALKIQAEFHRVLDRKNENAPAFEILCGKLRIGAAWERQGRTPGKARCSSMWADCIVYTTTSDLCRSTIM